MRCKAAFGEKKKKLYKFVSHRKISIVLKTYRPLHYILFSDLIDYNHIEIYLMLMNLGLISPSKVSKCIFSGFTNNKSS